MIYVKRGILKMVQNPEKHIFHRFDDIGKHSTNTELLIKKIEALKIPYILAVIPKELDTQTIKLINQLHYAIIFQHGCEHINKVKHGWFDEFPDSIPVYEVETKISQGKQKLERSLGVKIIAYVPPWNNTAVTTILTVEKLGFYIYSAQANNSSSIIRQLDINFDITKTYLPKIELKDLKGLKKDILNSSHKKEKIQGIMYHLNDVSMEQIKEIFEFIKDLVPYTIEESVLKRICSMEKN